MGDAVPVGTSTVARGLPVAKVVAVIPNADVRVGTVVAGGGAVGLIGGAAVGDGSGAVAAGDGTTVLTGDATAVGTAGAGVLVAMGDGATLIIGVAVTCPLLAVADATVPVVGLPAAFVALGTGGAVGGSGDGEGTTAVAGCDVGNGTGVAFVTGGTTTMFVGATKAVGAACAVSVGTTSVDVLDGDAVVVGDVVGDVDEATGFITSTGRFDAEGAGIGVAIRGVVGPDCRTNAANPPR
ncbi:MAG: hypothetical protein NVS4B8_14490 [Herpetosiphon sp.]